MARTLDVYLHDDLVGRLVQDDAGDITFRYEQAWLELPRAVPLSHSLPLRKQRFRRKECRGFFGGILPEQAVRELIARNLGISARNDYAMLERIGGECAGAVTFLPEGEALPERRDSYRELSDEEFAAILKELPRRPLLAGDQGVRLSLAGAQEKLAIRMELGRICLPLGGAPSTHIVKPDVDRFPGVVFNEAFCMRLAAAVGLPSARVETRTVGGIDFLLVARYDRRPTAAAAIARLHQEDFCQALAIVSEQKYQREGGPSLKQCFALLREVSSAPVLDLARFLDAVVFNYLVGNNDAHGKNFSLLYHDAAAGAPELRLAPLYDVVSTVAYPELSPEMAMRIGAQYSPENVTLRDWEQFAADAGLGKALVRARLREVIDRILGALPTVSTRNSVEENVARAIRGRCETAVARFVRRS